ncbi:hypothetical protein JYT16_01740 [Gemmatimonas aurantiaca]|nr:hypothetical protein [Gemmatimonas aurantiaca]
MKKLANIALLFGLFGVLLAVVNYYTKYPITISASEAEVYGEPLLRSVNCEVALIVDTSAIRLAGQSGRFSKTDWSYGWLNLLLQEEKRFDILDVLDVSNSTEAPTSNNQIMIVTLSVTTPLANNAQTILYELPSQPTLDALAPGALSIGADKQSVFSTTYGMQLELFPLSIDTSQAEALWDIEGHIVLARLHSTAEMGSKRTLVSGFDFGALAVRVQQGLPNDDFSVSPRITKRTGLLPLVTGDLVADSAHYERFEPFFDRFEHDYWQKITGGREQKKLFADSPHGAFIMSHDEEGIGDRAAWQPEQEQRWGVQSTVFVTPAAITQVGLQRMRNAGAEIGLHTDQYSYFERPGLPGLRPFRRVIAISDQRAHLEGLAPNNAGLHINRNHWLLWDNHYTAPLRKLAGAGITFDLSYGPLGEGLIGYIFGTAYPFVPLDTNGFPLPILELPFLFQDDERFAAEYLEQFWDTSSFSEEIVNVIFHSNTMGHSPDTLLIWAWRESFLQAKAVGLPILQYGDILEALRYQDATLPKRILR